MQSSVKLMSPPSPPRFSTMIFVASLCSLFLVICFCSDEAEGRTAAPAGARTHRPGEGKARGVPRPRGRAARGTARCAGVDDPSGGMHPHPTAATRRRCVCVCVCVLLSHSRSQSRRLDRVAGRFPVLLISGCILGRKYISVPFAFPSVVLLVTQKHVWFVVCRLRASFSG